MKLVLHVKIHRKINVGDIWKNIQKQKFEEKGIITCVHNVKWYKCLLELQFKLKIFYFKKIQKKIIGEMPGFSSM